MESFINGLNVVLMLVCSYLCDEKPAAAGGVYGSDIGDKTKTGILRRLSGHGQVGIGAVIKKIGGSGGNAKDMNKEKG
jgi:hypothetical protein